MLAPTTCRSFVDSTLFPAKNVDLHTTFAEDDGVEDSSNYQEGWYISYVDILTLLLTLFVILLSMSQTSAIVPDLPAPSTIETVETQAIPQPAIAEMATVVENQQTSKELEPPEINYTALPNTVALLQLSPLAPFSEFVLPPLLPEPAILERTADSRDWTYGITDSEVTVDAETGHGIDTVLHFPVNSASMKAIAEMVNSDEHTRIDTESQQEPQHQIADVAPIENAPWLQQIQAAMRGQNIEIMASKDHVDLVMSDQVLFQPGRADIKTAGGKLLGQLASMIRHTDLSLSVEGHTDNVPISSTQFPSNWELSTARATTVTRLLIDNNINADRIRAIGYADTQPRAANDTIEGRARNRRVSIVLHIPEQPAPVLPTILTR